MKNILFLTGHLAFNRLQKTLSDMQPCDFEYEVRDIGVSVAALMTADMIGRRLKDYDQFDQILLPGLCRGDLAKLSAQLGVSVTHGPIDIKDIPAYFGRDGKPIDLSHHDVLIFAEIVDAPMQDIDNIMRQAQQYQADGADVIDIGCLPDTPFPHLAEVIKTLADEGFQVSVDSLEEEDLLIGGRAGAHYLLSLKPSTLWIADEVASTPILISEQHTELDSLYTAIDNMQEQGKAFIADSILDPIHFGFSTSIMRYITLRQRYPDIDIMMGVGNITELTEADTTGINAVLFGLISELSLNAVLTTTVSTHCCAAIREADRARRIMYVARENKTIPKDIDDGLTTTHSRRPFTDTRAEIEELHQAVTDPSYRIQLSEQGIHVYNRDVMLTNEDPYELYEQLTLLHQDSSHAFYVGVELAKAKIAWQLAKPYIQDRPLDWGVATPPQAERTEHSSLKSRRRKRLSK